MTSGTLFGQTEEPIEEPKFNMIKLHKNFRFESLPNLIFNGDEFNYFVKRQNFFLPGLGISYTREFKNGNTLEIGIAEFMSGQNTETTTWTEGDSLIYGRVNNITYKRRDLIGEINFAKCIGQGKTDNWRFYAGLSIMPFLQSFDLEQSEDGFPVSINIVGATLTAYPAIQFKVFDNGWIDMRLPFQLIRAANVSGDNGDDFLNLFEEQQRETDFELLPAIYEFRIGLGIKF